MKKDILITVCVVFLVSNLHAQQKNFFAYYNHQIDSLVSIYSIEKPMGDGGNYFFSFEDEKLSAKEKKNLIVKIRKMFKQDEYPNLYYLGHKLLYNMAFYHQNNNSPQIRQMLLETYLQYYFYPGKGKYESLIYIYDVKYKFDYTKKAKKRSKHSGKYRDIRFFRMYCF